MNKAVLDRVTSSAPPIAADPASAHPRQGRWFKKTVWFLLLAAAVLTLASPWVLDQVQSLSPPIAVAEPPPQTPEIVVCLGYVDVETGVIALAPSQAGRIQEILVREDEEVTVGSPLLRLDDSVAKLQVQEARADLVAAKAHLAKAVQTKGQHPIKIAHQQAAVEAAGFKVSAAKYNHKARQKELEVKSIGRNQPDPVLREEVATLAEQVKELQAREQIEKEALRDLKQQNPALEENLMQAEVDKMQVKLLLAQKVLADHTLTAPQDGRIFRVLVAPGELLGTTEKKAALQFCPKGQLIIRAEVDQAYAKNVQVAQAVLIEDDMHSQYNWKGKIKSLSKWYTQKRLIAQEKFQLKDARTLECLVTPDETDCALLIGQRVRVTIQPPSP